VKRGLIFLVSWVLAASMALAQKPVIAQTSLKIGQPAPDFTLLSDQWQPVKLSEYRGKKNVILAFYVLAFTPG
jgi:peroxiredoxin